MVKYKRTLGLEERGDIYRDDQGKAQFFEGIRGVKMELEVMLSTVKGEQPFAPEFGFDVFEAANGGEAIIKREVRKTLTNDDRVRSVDSVVIEQTRKQQANRFADVTVNVTLVNN